MIHFSYVARMKRELIKCFDSQAQAGNSGRQYMQYKNSTQAESQVKLKQENEKTQRGT